MLETVGLSILGASLVDILMPNLVYSWREKLKARHEKRMLLRKSYHHSKGRRRS